MDGWHISVFRQADGGAAPARADSPRGTRIAVWQTSWGGCGWLEKLVDRGEAVALGGGGYPTRYTARAEHLIPPIIAGPPSAREVWVAGAKDVVTSAWSGETVIDRAAADACAPSEWLLVVAWDES